MAGDPVHPSWQESLDAALLARIQRRTTASGLISLSLARRILEGVEYLAGRLPLIAELSRRRGRAGEARKDGVPIVHARPARDVVIERGAAPPVDRVTTRTIERVVARPAPPKRDVLHDRAPSIAPRPLIVVQPGSPARATEIRVPRDVAPPPAPSTPVAPPSRLAGKQIERALPLRRPARMAPTPSVSTKDIHAAPAIPPKPEPEPVRIHAHANEHEHELPRVQPTEISPTTMHVETVRELIHRAVPPITTGPISPAASARVVEIGRSEHEVTMKVVHAITASHARPLDTMPVVAAPAPNPPAAARGPLVHVAHGGATPQNGPIVDEGVMPSLSLPLSQGHASRAVQAPVSASPGAAGTPQAAPSSRGPVSIASRGASGLDLEAVVDEVQRKLLRRLAAERERRGGLR